ncbi:hypothetical protein ACJ7VZ_05395 [Aeromonas salmonicida]|uniref:hypothetical protein n=1 Tax=Aeromonas salmonicida TaxID=645 RepID=UPI0038BD41F0
MKTTKTVDQVVELVLETVDMETIEIEELYKLVKSAFEGTASDDQIEEVVSSVLEY